MQALARSFYAQLYASEGASDMEAIYYIIKTTNNKRLRLNKHLATGNNGSD
jgi:hypothetical protein